MGKDDDMIGMTVDAVIWGAKFTWRLVRALYGAARAVLEDNEPEMVANHPKVSH